MKKIVHAVLIVAAVFVVGFFGVFIGVRYLFLGQITAPTPADFAKIAQKNQYIVQAAYAFKAEHGQHDCAGWPDSVSPILLLQHFR